MSNIETDSKGRFCTKCNTFKTWDLFDKKKNGICGHHSQCKVCTGHFKKKWWRKKNKKVQMKTTTLELKKSDMFEQIVDWNSADKIEFEKLMRSFALDIYFSRRKGG